MNSLSSLLCLTSDYSILSHSEQVRILLEEGAKFIQIRTKELSSHNLFDQVNIASKYAIENDATLIVNDFLDIANRAKFAGLHLGSNDCTVQDAREALGHDVIIGSTVHNFEEAKVVKRLGLSNYVGLGPYRHSRTKVDLNPILTTKNIREIVDYLYPIPVFLIGGIGLEECGLIEEFNLAGLAVCAALSSETQYGFYVKDFMNRLTDLNCVTI